ncbi:MAG: glycosyltransferase family 4 protein [Gemmatimonadales bacterium]
MRIAIFSEVYWPMVSGVAHTLGRTVDALRARGHAVRVYTASYALPAGAKDRPEVHRSPAQPFTLSPEVQWARPRLADIIADRAQFEPDVVHLATEFPMGRVGLKAAQRLGVPIVASAHTDYESYASRYGFGWAVGPGWIYLRRFYQHAKVVLAPSRTYQEQLRRRGVRHTGVWSRGVDTDRFHPDFRSDEYRASLGLKPGDLLVACVGRLAPEKGVDRLLDSWGALSSRHPRAHLAFTGSGVLEREVRQRGLPRVHLTGVLRGMELATAYASADVFVLPSSTETFGNVLLEAMASGTASIAMAAGGVLDYGKDGVNVRLVSPTDSVGHALDELLADDSLRSSLATGGRATALARTWDRVHDHLVRQYRAAAAWSPSYVRVPTLFDPPAAQRGMVG